MKIKCVKCENEYAVRKEVMEKRIAKGITEKNYVCLACQDKKINTIYNITCTKCGKVVKSNKDRSEKLIADGRMDTYLCRFCKPRVGKKMPVKKTKKTKKAKVLKLRDAKGRFMKAAK